MLGISNTMSSFLYIMPHILYMLSSYSQLVVIIPIIYYWFVTLDFIVLSYIVFYSGLYTTLLAYWYIKYFAQDT